MVLTGSLHAMSPAVNRNFLWQQSHWDLWLPIFRHCNQYLGSFRLGTVDEDIEDGIDVFLEAMQGGGVRLRRNPCRWRDLTIGIPYERDKIKRGTLEWCLYGWMGAERQISEWMLVNLAEVNRKGLLDNREAKTNNQNHRQFITISRPELRKHNCLIVAQVEIPEGFFLYVSKQALARPVQNLVMVAASPIPVWSSQNLKAA